MEKIGFNFHFTKIKDKIVRSKEFNFSLCFTSREYPINKSRWANYGEYNTYVTVKTSRSKERNRLIRSKRKKGQKTRKERISYRYTHVRWEKRIIKTFTPSWFTLKRPCYPRHISRISHHWSYRSKDRRYVNLKVRAWRHKIKQTSVWSARSISCLPSEFTPVKAQIRRNSIAKKYDLGILMTRTVYYKTEKPNISCERKIERCIRRRYLWNDINNALEFFIVRAREILLVRYVTQNTLVSRDEYYRERTKLRKLKHPGHIPSIHWIQLWLREQVKGKERTYLQEEKYYFYSSTNFFSLLLYARLPMNTTVQSIRHDTDSLQLYQQA